VRKSGRNILPLRRALSKHLKRSIRDFSEPCSEKTKSSPSKFIRDSDLKQTRIKLLKKLAKDYLKPLPDHCLKTLFKALFLRSGYVQDPRDKYHLEIRFSNPWLFRLYRSALLKHRLRFKFKICEREGKKIAYLKSRDEIVGFLNFLELFDRCLEFQDLVATRDLLNMVNRQVNFETANINKSVEASEELSDKIKQLFAYPNQEIWSEALKQIAILRVKHPLDSLETLGKRCIPPLSKSAVNHRFMRIKALHQKLLGQLQSRTSTLE